MSAVVYTSLVTIRRLGGPNREARLPAEPDPVKFGVHSAIAQHYGADVATYGERATTLDYVVAATGG